MIDNGMTGFSWEYDATVDEIANLIDKLFGDIKKFKDITKSAKDKLSSSFSIDWKNKRINQLIESL